MPDYYLAKLTGECPEEINYADKHPDIVKTLEQLHKVWEADVFKNSGKEIPNKTEKKEGKLPQKGTKKL